MTHAINVDLVGTGSVEDYYPARRAAILSSLVAAAPAGTLNASTATLNITGGSVHIRATFVTRTETDTAAATYALNAALSTPEAATSTLASASVVVEETVAVEPVSTTIVLPAPLPPPPPTTPPPATPPPLVPGQVAPSLGESIVLSGNSTSNLLTEESEDSPTKTSGLSMLILGGMVFVFIVAYRYREKGKRLVNRARPGATAPTITSTANFPTKLEQESASADHDSLKQVL